MADKAISNLDALALADVLEALVLEVENVGGTDPASRKMTLPQARGAVLDLSNVAAIASGAVTTAGLFLVQESSLADPTTRNVRHLTLPEMLLLMGSGVKLHGERAKVGTTAGWVVAAADNLGKMATIPAAQTSSTLVIPLTGLRVGEKITAFSLVGSIQSGGNAATITADLRKLTATSAGGTDASVGAMAAPLSVTANTLLNPTNAGKDGLTEVVGSGSAPTSPFSVTYYLLVTSTTGAACTEELQGVLITTAGV